MTTENGAQDDDDVFEEYRHANGGLVRVADGGEGTTLAAAKPVTNILSSQSSPPWMQRGPAKASGASRKRSRALLASQSEGDFIADDDDEAESDEDADEDEDELSDGDSDSESSLGSASDEGPGNGFGAYAGGDYDYSTNPNVASGFRAPVVKSNPSGGAKPAARLTFSMKTKPTTTAAAKREYDSEDEDSDSGSTTDEDSEEELRISSKSETRAKLEALAKQARQGRQERGTVGYRQREDYVMQREDDEFDDYRPDQDDWKKSGGEELDEDRAYEECKSMSKRLRNTLKEAQSAAKGKLPVFSVDNAVEAMGGMESGTFAVNLKPYQMVGVNFLMLLQQNGIPGAILADEMGLGKTAQAISFVAMSRYHPDTGVVAENGVRWPRVESAPNPVLVVSPASLLENWKRELGMWAPGMKVGVFHGDSREEVRNTEEYHRERTGKCCYDVIIVCYSLFERDSVESQDNRSWLQKMEFSHLILDEAHLLKNREAQRTIRLTRTARKAHYRLLLTGTPLQNNLRELEALIEFILPGLLKEGELGDGIDDEQAERRVKKVRRILEPFVLRRLKETVATQLAPKTQIKEVIDMNGHQAQTYKLAVERIRAEADRQRDITIANAYRDAQKIKGEGDAEAARVYAEAFGKDPQFAQFYRSLDAYKESFSKKSDVLVLDPSQSDFFKAYRSGGSAGK